MHDAVLDWVGRCVDQLGPFSKVVEIGSRDINGSVRSLFADADEYIGVDVVEGPGVDVHGDVIDLVGDELPVGAFDCVVSTEALEHHPEPAAIVAAAAELLTPGGVFIATMAGPGRHPHSGLIEGPVQPGEHYENITPDVLAAALAGLEWDGMEIDQRGLDLRCWARKAG